MPYPLPKMDRAGRPQKDPQRLGHGIGYAVWLAQLVPPKLVPSEFWSLDRSDDDEPVAIVACPCGKSPGAPLLGAVVPCECGRYFFFEGRDVWCYKQGEADAVDSDEETTIVPT